MSATTNNVSLQRMCQGEIFYVMPPGEIADKDTFYGGRPAIIVSNDMINEYNGVVSVVYLTTHPKNNLPTRVEINETARKSWAICEQITTISKRRIGKYIGECSSSEKEEIKRAMAVGLTMDIEHMGKKSVSEMIKAWYQAMNNSYTTDEIDEYSVEDFETPDKKEAPVTVIQPPAPRPVAPELKVIDPPKVIDSPEYIKLQAERDTYKQMYEKIISTMLAGNTGTPTVC